MKKVLSYPLKLLLEVPAELFDISKNAKVS